jgi:hypothetical protein
MNLNTSSKLALALLLVALAFSLQAGDTSVKCDKKSLADTIAKLDKSVPNTVIITGDCNEDIVISGYKDLTLNGLGGASISATVFNPADFGASTTALSVENSNVTLRNLTINGGRDAVSCFSRSVCTLHDVTIPSGWGGAGAQEQSTLNIYGSSSITGLLGTAVGVFGASRVNMSPAAWGSGWDPADAGPVLSGNDLGLHVQDGSFFRSDNVSITHNATGIFAQRNAMLKIFSRPEAGLPGLSFNTYEGIFMQLGVALQIGLPITDNGGDGIWIGALSSAQRAGGLSFSNNGGLDVSCNHPTAIDVNFGECP